jgi:hypothetical protein
MSIISLVPFSVRQRGRGLVRDPAVHGYSLLDPQWVPVGTTVSDRKKASMIKKADRVIAVLARFVARVARSYRFRKIFGNGDLAWSVIMEREDTHNRNERDHPDAPPGDILGDIPLNHIEHDCVDNRSCDPAARRNRHKDAGNQHKKQHRGGQKVVHLYLPAEKGLSFASQGKTNAHRNSSQGC